MEVITICISLQFTLSSFHTIWLRTDACGSDDSCGADGDYCCSIDIGAFRMEVARHHCTYSVHRPLVVELTPSYILYMQYLLMAGSEHQPPDIGNHCTDCSSSECELKLISRPVFGDDSRPVCILLLLQPLLGLFILLECCSLGRKWWVLCYMYMCQKRSHYVCDVNFFLQ